MKTLYSSASAFAKIVKSFKVFFTITLFDIVATKAAKLRTIIGARVSFKILEFLGSTSYDPGVPIYHV